VIAAISTMVDAAIRLFYNIKQHFLPHPLQQCLTGASYTNMVHTALHRLTLR
jgi:hypothetical protein